MGVLRLACLWQPCAQYGTRAGDSSMLWYSQLADVSRRQTSRYTARLLSRSVRTAAVRFDHLLSSVLADGAAKSRQNARHQQANTSKSNLEGNCPRRRDARDTAAASGSGGTEIGRASCRERV